MFFLIDVFSSNLRSTFIRRLSESTQKAFFCTQIEIKIVEVNIAFNIKDIETKIVYLPTIKEREMQKIIIAIDGYSSTGKSSTAKVVAKKLGYVYVDTGAMYRAVTYLAMQKGFVEKKTVKNTDKQQDEQIVYLKEQELLTALKNSDIKFKYNPELQFSEIYLNDVNIEKEIRSIEVANLVSEVAKVASVRAYLVDLQRKFSEEKGIVMDGRDIGSVVFPNAELKIFMTASEQIRAERRYKELLEKGEEVSFEEVLKNVQYRDFLDTTRKESPLLKAKDAVEIDNSNLTFDQQVQKILDLANQRISDETI
ncbi:cytidylate kinase [Capnocytophaga canis]|nr:cytidylate kinase [Capnocytophaga canis]